MFVESRTSSIFEEVQILMSSSRNTWLNYTGIQIYIFQPGCVDVHKQNKASVHSSLGGGCLMVHAIMFVLFSHVAPAPSIRDFMFLCVLILLESN